MNTHPALNTSAVTAGQPRPTAHPTPSTLARARAALYRRFYAVNSGDAGMSTVEYAVGTIAAAAFGAVLYTVVSGDSIPDALGGIIEQALNTSV